MARSDFRKLLHDGKFTEVTFMDSMTFPDFSQVYQVPADSEVKTSTTPAPVVKSGQDDAAFVIQNCGKPDREFTESASGATIRHLVYRRFNTELFFFPCSRQATVGIGECFRSESRRRYDDGRGKPQDAMRQRPTAQLSRIKSEARLSRGCERDSPLRMRRGVFHQCHFGQLCTYIRARLLPAFRGQGAACFRKLRS